ncbi:MAG: tRNA-guanine transglycosylase [Oscillospiraceae bacterium]|nr:tRNA-guanine transglycosylase [Oscillospiraceae bacterium]
MRKNQSNLILPHGNINLPAFFPDGTRGVVRSVDLIDLENCGVQGIVMNAYHLMSNPGQSVVKSIGGLNKFINWNRPVLTDSGGFQVFSLIRENSKFGEIQDKQIVFKSEKSGEKIIFTPEKCIRAQFDYGSDIMMCLDYCTHPNDSDEINKKSVDITIKWAKRCKDEYNNKIAGQARNDGLAIPDSTRNRNDNKNRPLIFGIIQGGNDKILRKECADALISIGFDGFGFGGWPLDDKNNLTYDILEYTAGLMPDNLVKYAMGLGKPDEIVACYKMGYNLFDCVIPTREARHNRLYMFNEEYNSINDIDLSSQKFYGYYYITDDKHRRDSRPVSNICDCHCCKNYSRAYLRHLAIIGDSLANRLATVHNLRFYTKLMELLIT